MLESENTGMKLGGMLVVPHQPKEQREQQCDHACSAMTNIKVILEGWGKASPGLRAANMKAATSPTLPS